MYVLLYIHRAVFPQYLMLFCSYCSVAFFLRRCLYSTQDCIKTCDSKGMKYDALGFLLFVVKVNPFICSPLTHAFVVHGMNQLRVDRTHCSQLFCNQKLEECHVGLVLLSVQVSSHRLLNDLPESIHNPSKFCPACAGDV